MNVWPSAAISISVPACTSEDSSTDTTLTSFSFTMSRQAARGRRCPAEEMEQTRVTLQSYLAEGDPYYNPNLAVDSRYPTFSAA